MEGQDGSSAAVILVVENQAPTLGASTFLASIEDEEKEPHTCALTRSSIEGLSYFVLLAAEMVWVLGRAGRTGCGRLEPSVTWRHRHPHPRDRAFEWDVCAAGSIELEACWHFASSCPW